MSNAKTQVVLCLVGEHGAGKTFIADKLLKKFGFASSISPNEPVVSLLTNPKIFNLPRTLLNADQIDKKFSFPIHTRENHLRRAIRTLWEGLPPSASFNPNTVAISNFILPIIETPRALIEYLKWDVFNRLDPDFVATCAFNRYLGKPGFFVCDGINSENELDIARKSFPIVYTVSIKRPKNPEYKYRPEENWKSIEADFELSNSNKGDLDKDLEEMMKVISEDLQKRIQEGRIPPLPDTFDTQVKKWVDSKGPLARPLQKGEKSSGNAIFREGQVDAPITNDKIRLYHNPQDIDRSGLQARR